MPDFLDILHDVPRARLESTQANQTLTFAFATGCGNNAFERLFAHARPTTSSFSRECFATDLFLDSFVELCLSTRLTTDGRKFYHDSLLSLLTSPPRNRADTQLRQGVFRELGEQPELLAACEQTWRRIDTLRLALESSCIGKRASAISRRIEILSQLGEVVRELSGAFNGSRSALARIGQYFATLTRQDSFERLNQLIDCDGHLATLDLRVTVGRNGQIRNLLVLARAENAVNSHYLGPIARFWDRIVIFFLGYSIRDQELMGRVVESVFEGVQPALLALLELQLQLEFYLSLVGLTKHCAARGLDTCLPELSTSEPMQASHFEALFNPFLLREEQPPVPCDLELPESGMTFLTGPNSGGKTRLLQALGLSQLLAQCGAPIPARRARLSWREGMFVSLVHEMSADQREGRLGTELLRIRRLFDRIGIGELVLLDELCSGTNPSEGEEIVELVILLLSRLQPQAVVTTHFLQFAARLAQSPPVPGLGFLQVELDEHQLPRYRFVPGVASTSLAAKTAERLGVTREALEALIERKSTYLGRTPEKS